MTESKKKEQNKSYYEKNKQRILERAKLKAGQSDNHETVVSLFAEANEKSEIKSKRTEKKSKEPLKQRISLPWLLLICLIALMTSFLFHETSKFFYSLDQDWIGACVKSAILEGAAIALTLIPAKNRVWSVINPLLVVCIYGFGVWAMSYPIMHSTHTQMLLNRYQHDTVSELENEISKKEAMRDQYWRQDRTSLAKKYDQSLEGLRAQLTVARNQSIETPTESHSQGLLLSGILFRILVVLANLSSLQSIRKLSLNRGASCPK